VLNERNAVFTRMGPNRSAICNSFPGPTRVLNANAISIASEFSAELTRWHTDRQTDRPRYSVVHSMRHLPTY